MPPALPQIAQRSSARRGAARDATRSSVAWEANLRRPRRPGRDTAQAMSQENVAVVCGQFAATNERDFPRAMSHYAEDVELVVDPDAFLERGTFKGRHAVGQWFANWFRTFEPGYHFDIEEA